MTNYSVKVAGCDGETVVVLDLTDDEHAVVRRLAAATQAASGSACEPVVTFIDGEEPGRAE